MKFKVNSVLSCLLIFVFIAVFRAHGQESQAGVWFRVVGFETDVSGLFFREGQSFTPFEVVNQRPSQFFRHVGSSELVFYRMVDQPGEPDPIPVPAVQVRIPSGATQVLLICRKSSGGQLTVLPLLDDLERFPAGRVLYANFTRSETAIRLDRENIERVSSGERTLLDLPTREGRSTFVLNFSVVRAEDGTWTRIVDSNIRFRSNFRYLYIGTDTGEMGAYYLWTLQENATSVQRALQEAEGT